jgi:hypothetical protein
LFFNNFFMDIDLLKLLPYAYHFPMACQDLVGWFQLKIKTFYIFITFHWMIRPCNIEGSMTVIVWTHIPVFLNFKFHNFIFKCWILIKPVQSGSYRYASLTCSVYGQTCNILNFVLKIAPYTQSKMLFFRFLRIYWNS